MKMWSTIFLTVFCVIIVGNSAHANIGVESNDINLQYLSTNINWIVDTFLSGFIKATIETNKSVVEIEDIKEEFEKHVLFVDLYGSFEAKDGSLKNVSTIHRTGNATLSESGGKVFISVYLGLQELQINFNNIYINFLDLKDQGTVTARVGTNSIRLDIQVTYKPECSVTLSDLKLEVLDNINVKITGLSVFDSFASDITTWVINATEELYRPQLEKLLYTEMAKAVVDADICHHLPF